MYLVAYPFRASFIVSFRQQRMNVPGNHALLPKAYGKSSLVIIGRLWRSLGQTSTSAKSESDWIRICHVAPPKGYEAALESQSPTPQEIGHQRVDDRSIKAGHGQSQTRAVFSFELETAMRLSWRC